MDYNDFEVFESAYVAEVMKRRREGSCEYSRRNNEARRCGKMTESPVTFVSGSASEASSGSDDILCPPPSNSQDSAESEASSGSDDVLCPSQLRSSQQQRNLNSLRNSRRFCVVVKDPHRPGTQLAVPKKVQSSNCAASANCSFWFSVQPWGVGVLKRGGRLLYRFGLVDIALLHHGKQRLLMDHGDRLMCHGILHSSGLMLRGYQDLLRLGESLQHRGG